MKVGADVSRMVPLDFAILGLLPDEGKRLGYHNIGMPVRHMLEELNADGPPEAAVTSAEIQGRLRGLKFAGLATHVTITPVGDGLGWQITPAGRRALIEGGS